MKQGILFILIGAVIGGSLVWFKAPHAGAPPAGESAEMAKPASDEPEPPKIARDAEGRAVITVDDDLQGDMGILVAQPAAAELSPETRAYGRVLDPAPLSGLIIELASAQAAATVSIAEFNRLKSLEAQGNTSIRAVQTAESVAVRDQLSVRSTREKIILAWGREIGSRADLADFAHVLSVDESAIVRLDLPAGDPLQNPAGPARIITLTGASIEASLVGLAPTVDPQWQGRGFLYFVRTNTLELAAGQAVTGFLRLPGQPLKGVIIPRESVVRTEGSAWIYVLGNGGEDFTRIEISLDRPTAAGWFVSKGVTVNDFVVGTGAQQLLSIELRGPGGAE